MGRLVPVNRHGFNKLADVSPLSKATFEQNTEQFKLAALHELQDPVESVSSRIMFGLPIKGGTNAFDIVIDEDKFGVGIDDIDELFE